jgi:hypothetical protein
MSCAPPAPQPAPQNSRAAWRRSVPVVRTCRRSCLLSTAASHRRDRSWRAGVCRASLSPAAAIQVSRLRPSATSGPAQAGQTGTPGGAGVTRGDIRGGGGAWTPGRHHPTELNAGRLARAAQAGGRGGEGRGAHTPGVAASAASRAAVSTASIMLMHASGVAVPPPEGRAASYSEPCAAEPDTSSGVVGSGRRACAGTARPAGLAASACMRA